MKQFLSSILAVLASFFGVRSRKNFDKDIKNLSPLYLIAAGFLGVLLFVALLIVVVKMVVHN